MLVSVPRMSYHFHLFLPLNAQDSRRGRPCACRFLHAFQAASCQGRYYARRSDSQNQVAIFQALLLFLQELEYTTPRA